MAINIIVTSKPVDGLFYYSYEYCNYLNEQGIDSRVVVVTHKNFSKEQYIEVIEAKYEKCRYIYFDQFLFEPDDITLVMGRSMITLSYKDFNSYDFLQQRLLKDAFGNKVISVYSENHPKEYPLALAFYNPKHIIDLCDREVYPNGIGHNFEKRIYFRIYRHLRTKKSQKRIFKYLFLGTNEQYYKTVEKYIDKFPDHGILTYDEKYVNIDNNNIFVPVTNLMSMFQTYVYTKSTFDPAPRIIQECKYFNKDMIYMRDKNIIDGGSVYWKRDCLEPDITPILDACNLLKEGN